MLGKTFENVYQEIEDNKNPHIWSSLAGKTLDDTGTFVNCPRKPNEDDANYRYRLMNWVLRNEASNTTAISDELLQMTYASNIDYRPFTKGSGTATCYVIPRTYNKETIANALKEAAERVSKVASPSLHVEYIIPKILGVRLQIYISASNGDIEAIKSNISGKILEYINAIPPQKYLKVGEINKIGVNESGVDYFNVLSLIIDNQTVDSLEVLQGIDTKMLFDEIIWTGDE